MEPQDIDFDEYEDFEEQEVVEEKRLVPDWYPSGSFAREVISNIRVNAKQCIDTFFKNKMFHCGGKIPNRLLNCDCRISMVMNFDIGAGVDRAYNALEKTMSVEELERARNTGETTDDIRLVNESLYMLSQNGIPQQFAGGMLCLYLEFIEGVDFVGS